MQTGEKKWMRNAVLVGGLAVVLVMSMRCDNPGNNQDKPKMDTMNASAASAEVDSKPFYLGVYIYEYRFMKLAREQGMDYFTYLEKHLKIFRDHGINAIYLGGTDTKHFDRVCAMTAKYGIKLIPQLDSVYFRDNWTDEQMLKVAKRAGEFIAKHDNPQVLAWSVKEEVRHDSINKLCRYYFMIRQHAPSARFNLINSNLGAARDMPVPEPYIMGTDRYAFWWEFSGNGYLASPGFSLGWVRQQAAEYYREAAKRGADFMLVITQGGLVLPGAANRCANIKTMRYPRTGKEKRKLHQRVMTFAKEGRMGWARFDTPTGPRYNVWKYYRLPPNCMRALAWTAVLEGARLFFCWSYTPPDKATLAQTFRSSALSDRSEISLWTLAGRPGRPNPQLEEFAAAGREIRRFERIITRMCKLPASPVSTNEKKGFFCRAFSFPGLRGSVVVLHNANVGTWPGNSRRMFKDSDPIRIDENGNLVGYKPFTKPMPVELSLVPQPAGPATSASGIFALASEDTVRQSGEKYSVLVAPGSGTMVFVGTASEAEQLRRLVK